MKTILILLLIPLFLTSCFHVYYAPNTVAAPMLSHKNEVRINGLYAYGGDSEYDGGELQLAYAIKDNWGLMFNSFFAGNSHAKDEYYETGHGSYFEAGAGYFNRFEPGSKWMYECYGGLGFGSVTNDYDYLDYSKVGVTKFFIQPSVGFKSRYFEFAFVPRMGVVNWKVQKEQIQNSQNDYLKTDLQAISNKPTFFAFEPGIILRGGAEGFKLQAGFTLFTNNHFYYDFAESANFNLGVSINLNRMKKPGK